MTIGLEINADVIVLGSMVKMLDPSGNTLDGQPLSITSYMRHICLLLMLELPTWVRYLVEPPFA